MNNLQSIIGGISRGLNAKKTPQITKESTQSPALPWDSKSPGTTIRFQNPIPSGVPDVFKTYTQTSYQMSPKDAAHWKAYFAKPLPLTPPQFYLAGLGVKPSIIMNAAQTSQGIATDGSPDVWQNHWQVFRAMQKGYSPAQSYY